MVKTLPSNAGGVSSIPGELKPHMTHCQKNQNTKQYCKKFNKDFKNGPHLRNSDYYRRTHYCHSLFSVLLLFVPHLLPYCLPLCLVNFLFVVTCFDFLLVSFYLRPIDVFFVVTMGLQNTVKL